MTRTRQMRDAVEPHEVEANAMRCGEINRKDKPLSRPKDAMLRTQVKDNFVAYLGDPYSLHEGNTNVFLMENACWALEYSSKLKKSLPEGGNSPSPSHVL